MNTTIAPPKRLTLATVKAFIRENAADLYINVTSKFSGMTDGVERVKSDFEKVEFKQHTENDLGIPGAWFVGSSRDNFAHYQDARFEGIEVYNSCGSFTLAIRKKEDHDALH